MQKMFAPRRRVRDGSVSRHSVTVAAKVGCISPRGPTTQRSMPAWVPMKTSPSAVVNAHFTGEAVTGSMRNLGSSVLASNTRTTARISLGVDSLPPTVR